MSGLSRLISRRRRRGTWLYIVCLVLYVLYALGYAEEAAFHSGAPLSALWYLVIPLLVIVVQLAYPTLLGWAGVLGGFAFYLVTGAYYLVLNFGWSQWRVDTSGFVMGLVLLAALLGVCLGLYRYRPASAPEDAEGGT